MLCKSSVVGFENHQLNIYKLALFNRCKYMLARALKNKEQSKGGVFVELHGKTPRKEKHRVFKVQRMLVKYFLASKEDLEMARNNIISFQRNKKVLPINFSKASTIERLVFLQQLEDTLRG